MRRDRIRILVIALVALVTVGCSAMAAAQPRAEETSVPVISEREASVISEGRLVPGEHVMLSLAAGGEIAEVLVSEGDRVSAGQELLRLETSVQRAIVQQAESALAAARATLAKLEAGLSSEEVAVARVAVASSEATFAVALTQVEIARAGVAAAEGQIARAQATLRDIQAGPTADDREIARLSIELAKNELWGAQSYRDGVGGAVKRNQAQSYDLDRAEAAVGAAWEAKRIAELQLSKLEAGSRPGMVAQAEAGVEIATAQRVQAEAQTSLAEDQVSVAQAAIARAKAQLDLVMADPAPADRDAMAAAIAQAEAALRAATIVLEDSTLRAPMSGTVAWLAAKPGEQVRPSTSLMRLADLDTWYVETTDLTEIDVVRVTVGQNVTLVPDALPDLSLTGTVESISDLYADQRGDVTYEVRIRLDGTDPRLRWGMTFEVTFDT